MEGKRKLLFPNDERIKETKTLTTSVIVTIFEYVHILVSKIPFQVYFIKYIFHIEKTKELYLKKKKSFVILKNCSAGKRRPSSLFW